MAAKPKIVVIVGPTASGKTSLAIELAKQFNGEVVSADSRQVYRHLNIGTAKVTKEEMRGVPHYLIDIVEPEQTYTVADFKRDAAEALADISGRGKLPIIAGGTFFYIDVLLERVSTPDVPPNKKLRAELELLSAEQLANKLKALDPIRHLSIDRKNPRRLIRAIEIATALGQVPQFEIGSQAYLYEVLVIGIEVLREELRARFRARAADWLARGFRVEVANLLEHGISRERLREIGFEYRLGLQLIDGELTEAEFIERFEEKNWQYTKRQLTWLKRDDSIEWFKSGENEKIVERVAQFLNN